MRAGIRLLTAIAMIGICGFSVAQGWRIVHFSLAMVNIDSSEKRAEIINTWSAVPGLASTALRAGLTDEINPSDPKAANRRREALSAILSIKPLSSIDWLSLSGMQLVTDQPMEQVLGSLKLSMLTGPNEGYVMTERGIFGVSLWESLSPDLKSRVAVDLGPMIFPRTPAEGAESGQISGRSFRKTRAGAERATRGPSRHRAFAERDRTTTGILASRPKVSSGQLHPCVSLMILPRSWRSLNRKVVPET